MKALQFIVLKLFCLVLYQLILMKANFAVKVGKVELNLSNELLFPNYTYKTKTSKKGDLLINAYAIAKQLYGRMEKFFGKHLTVPDWIFAKIGT